jgi:hypothetical protein
MNHEFFIFKYDNYKGIKPCVSAFGGNQFEKTQTRYIETFFSVFYLSINVGSTIATLVTPIFRGDIKCFGNNCYPLVSIFSKKLNSY